MINHLAVAFLFCLVGTIANAQKKPEEPTQLRQLSKTVVCAPIETIFGALSSNDVQELPIWVGKDQEQQSQWAVFVNQKTGTFTIVQFGVSTACVIGMGTDSNILAKTNGL